MKTPILFLALILAGAGVLAQNTSKDSIRKNEVSINLAPAIQLLSSSIPGGNSHVSLDYYRNLKSALIFHAGFSFFPFTANQQYYTGSQYYRTVGDKNIFQSYSYNPQVKIQLGTGLEFNFRSRKFSHGYGIDLLIGHQYIYSSSSYTWAKIGEEPFSHVMRGDTTNHNVDSLGFFERSKEASLGIHLFYSLRYQFTKRLFLMLQVGPSTCAVFAERRKEEFNTKRVTTSNDIYIDFPMPLISRISLGMKF